MAVPSTVRIRTAEVGLLWALAHHQPPGANPRVERATNRCQQIGVILLRSEVGDRADHQLVVTHTEFGADRSALADVDDDRSLVVVRTYSKVWSMAALRLGYCVGPTWLVAELDKVVLPYHLAAATQAAGIAALRYREEMAARVRELVAERERLLDALGRIDGVDPVPSGANFILFRVDGSPSAARAAWEGLVAHRVLVRDFSAWPGVEGCLRVTVGTRAENDAFLAALGAVVRESGVR